MAATPKTVETPGNTVFSALSGEAFSDKIPALLWTTDLAYRITSLSGAEITKLGIPATQLLARSVGAFFQTSAPGISALDAHIRAAGGHATTFETEINGSELQARVEPLRDSISNIIGLIGIAVESTEQLVAQRALRISEHSYRTLIEDVPYAVCRCTATGNLLQVNRAMLEMLGYSEPDLLLRNLQWGIFAEPEAFTHFSGSFRGRAPSHGFETQWLRQDGQSVTVSLGGRASRDASGEISYLDIVAENISDRKHLEDQLRQAQKMQAVGQLAGGIAHDFNNMLTVIRGQIEVMTEEMLASDPLRCRIEEVERAAERATALTRQLLAFSRRQVMQTKILDLNNVIANMNQMLARLIGENIELSFISKPEIWRVKVDPGQIEHVLMNLAVNARDAMPRGGRLTIETQNMGVPNSSEQQNLNPGDYVLLKVSDSGHGMDEETKARIFEPFFTTKEPGQGTGLGLSMVYGVVKQSGGYIYAESRPQEGSAFKIYLPRANGAAEQVPHHPRMATPKGTETILVVEDDESIRQLVSGFLRAHGYHVLTAAEGVDALQLVKNHGPAIDLLLSDMVMPKMGGRELAAELRKSLPQLKVVFVSGYAGDPDRQLGLDAAARFVQKPFSMQFLATTVREALDVEAQ